MLSGPPHRLTAFPSADPTDESFTRRQFPPQPHLPTYSETEFQGLDYIIDSAGRHNIKLILALGNTWAAYRSPQDFMRMAGVNPGAYDQRRAYHHTGLG